MAYFGDTKEKKLARTASAILAHKSFRNLYPESKLRSAVTLAGTDAGDFGVLKHMWKFDASRCHFVDEKTAHLESSRKILATEWPAAQAHKGSLKNVLSNMNEGIDYLILDFMGQYTQSVQDVLLAAKKNLLYGSIVSYTFCRSHEKESNPYWARTTTHARLSPNELLTLNDEKKELLLKDRRRFMGYAHMMCDTLKGDDTDFKWIVLGKFRYHMGMIVIQKVQANPHIIGFNGDPINIKVDDDDIMLRKMVCQLQSQGYKSKEISDIMQISRGRVAAWMANNTRGSYL